MTRNQARSNSRKGFSLLEVAAAAALLAVALTLASQFAVEIARTERDAWRRQQALLLAQQRLERAMARPYDALAADRLADLALSPEEGQRLGGGTLRFDVEDEATPLAAKRVAVVVDFKDARGQPTAPVRLTAWSYPHVAETGGAP